MKCPHCGTSDLQDVHRFCFNCGKKIFLEEEIKHEEENASNEKKETANPCGGGENKLERNVINDKSGQHHKYQMERKPLNESNEVPMQDAKTLASEQGRNAQSATQRSTSNEAETKSAQLQADGNSRAVSTGNSAPQQPHTGFSAKVDISVAETKIDETRKDAKNTVEVLKSLTSGSPRDVTSEYVSPAEGDDKKHDEKGSVSNKVPMPKVPQDGTLVKEAVSEMEEDEMKGVDKSISTENEGHSTETSKSESKTPANQKKPENLRKSNNQDFEHSVKTCKSESETTADQGKPENLRKCNNQDFEHSTKTSKSESETPADQGKSENLGENNNQDFEHSVETSKSESETTADQGKSENLVKNNNQDFEHSTTTSKSESETPADQRKSENLGENHNQESEQHNSVGLSKKQPSDMKDVHQVANDLTPGKEPNKSSPGSRNSSPSAIGGSKNNEDSLVKKNHEQTQIASEKNKTTKKLDNVEDVEQKATTEEPKGSFTTTGEKQDRKQQDGDHSQLQSNSNSKRDIRNNNVEDGGSVSRSKSTAAKDGNKVNVQRQVNILDIFENDERGRMTVVFHAILAPQFDFSQEGDQVFMRFGGSSFKKFKVDILEMKPLRQLDDGFILLEGELNAPVDVLRDKRPYKYIVRKLRKESELYVWEHLLKSEAKRNRCLNISKDYSTVGATWHQYDAAIYPEPTFWQSVRNRLPLIKAMDPVQSRELATLAMLPRWEGFCKDEQEGVKMTAWEAVRKVLDVQYCMCNSETLLDYKDHTLSSDVPKEYDFRKALKKYLKPRISMNAKLEVAGRKEKHILEVQQLRLASSIAIAFLCSHFNVTMDGESLKDLLQALTLHFDSSTKTCSEFESLKLHFPEEDWPRIGKAIQRVCNNAAKDMYIHHEWLLAVPLMHFLLRQSFPFEPVLPITEEPRGEEWWGAQGLETKAVRNRRLTGTDSLAQITPLFELDPLFRRTFLLALPLKDYTEVTGLVFFSPIEVFTTVAKILPEKSSWGQEEWIAICTSVANQSRNIQNMFSQKTQPDEDAKTKALFTAKTVLRVLFAILKSENLKYLDTVLQCINLISYLLPVFQECDENAEQSKESNHSVSRKIFTDLHNSMKNALRNHFFSKMPCYNLEIVDQELQIWSSLFSCVWTCKQHEEDWTLTLLNDFKLRLEQHDANDLVELLSKLDMKNYHNSVAECITAVTFEKVEEMLMHGQEGDKLFESLSRYGINCPQATKCGELLTMMLLKCWPKPTEGSSELSSLVVLKHVLTWKLWQGYFECFGKQSQYITILNPDGQEKLLIATTALESIGEKLKSGQIKVCFLRLLRDNFDQFVKLHKLVSEKDKSLKDVLQRRCQELKAFEKEREEVDAFINSCLMLKQVNLEPAHQKLQDDVSGIAIGDLTKEMNSKPEPVVVYFGLSSSTRSMIQSHYNVKNSLFFQEFWKDQGKKILKHLTEQEPSQVPLTFETLHRRVWNPAYESLTLLRDRFISGDISLKETDNHFVPFQGRYDELEQELLRMHPPDISNSVQKSLTKRIIQLELYHKLHRFVKAAQIILGFKDSFGLTGDFAVVENIKEL